MIKFILKTSKIEKYLKEIIMQNAELYQAITDLPAQLSKVQAEITGKIDELNTAVATALASTGTDVPQTVVDAMAAVTNAVATLDALVPDVPA